MGSVRRNTELGLLVLVSLIVVGAYMLVSLAEASDLPQNIVPFLGIMLGVQAIGHLTIRRFAPDADGMLFPLASLLTGLGYVFIVRIDEARPSPAGLAGLQATWVIIGIAAFVATLALVPQTRTLERYRYTVGLGGLILLMLPLAPVIGRTINGNRIWVAIGPINFQPGEFAKLALAVFFAGYLYEKRELLAIGRAVGPFSIPDPKYLGPLLVAWGASLIIMTSQRDMGSSLLFFTLFLVMIWVATERASYLAVGAVLFLAGSVFAVNYFDHVRQRVDLLTGGFRDLVGPIEEGQSQIDAAAFAFADGGLAGTGLNLGSPTRIPEVQTDFIFAAIGEELGLVGAVAILVAYLLMIGAGLRIAQHAASGFDRLLATGLTTLLGFQAFIIIAGVTRLLPLTGITLPFVSYGGSSLLANYILVAVLLRISHNTARHRAEQAAAEQVTQVTA
jgi:cell division protein FtsW (lipid II flippase)